MRPWLVRLHRWLTWIFALPLLAVVGTGAVLSLDPVLARLQRPASPLPAAAVEAALRQADPMGKTRSLALDLMEGTMSLGLGGTFRLADGVAVPEPGEGWDWYRFCRGLHQTLLLEDDWLVVASSFALVALLLLGLLMGVPRRLNNSLLGWHRGLGWGLAPLLLLGPVTGLLMAYGIGRPERQAVPGAPPPMLEAVRLVAASRGDDLRDVVWIRNRRGQQYARLWDGGELRTLVVTQQGLIAQPRFWPRLLHEGNWGGAWSGLLNLAGMLALLVLIVTGPLMWARRHWRARQRRRAVA